MQVTEKLQDVQVWVSQFRQITDVIPYDLDRSFYLVFSLSATICNLNSLSCYSYKVVRLDTISSSMLREIVSSNSCIGHNSYFRLTNEFDRGPHANDQLIQLWMGPPMSRGMCRLAKVTPSRSQRYI